MLQDLRYAIRSFLRTPAFTGAALLTLALGIGANAAIYSVVHAHLLQPLPFADDGRLVRVAETNERLGLRMFSASYLNFKSFQERTRTIEQLAGFTSANANSRARARPTGFPRPSPR